MFIWKKTYEKKCAELKKVYGVVEGAAYDIARFERDLIQSNEAFAKLHADYALLQSKHAHLREVLENIRIYGGLLPRHRRSITAALKN